MVDIYILYKIRKLNAVIAVVEISFRIITYGLCFLISYLMIVNRKKQDILYLIYTYDIYCIYGIYKLKINYF